MRRSAPLLPFVVVALATSCLTTAPATAAGVGTVTGRVTTGTSPVAGVPVTARTTSDQVLASTTTRADGSYTVTGVPSGPVSVCAGGSTDPLANAPLGYALACSLSSDDAAGAAPVRVAPGQTRSGVGLVVRPAQVLTGAVLDPSGAPLSGATVRAYHRGGSGVVTGADGRYRLVVGVDRPGLASFTPCVDAVTAGTPTAPYGTVQTCAGSVVGAPGQQTEVPPVTVTAAGALGGRVTDAAGRPLAGVRVPWGTSSGLTGSVETAADGRWQTPGFDPAVQVRFGFDATDAAGGRDRWGHLSACWGDHVVTSAPTCRSTADAVSPEAGVLTADLDTTLVAAGALGGALRDAAGAAAAGVQLTLTRVDDASRRTAVTGADGSWQVDGLPAGRYTVCATDTGGRYERACVGGGRDLTRAARVVVHENGRTTADLTVSGPGLAPDQGVATVRFVDAAHQPLENVSVSWVLDDSPDVHRSTRAASDGRTTVGPTGPGTYTVCATPSVLNGTDEAGLADTCRRDVQVSSGAATDVGDVVVAPGGRIAGRVTDTAGYPLSGWSMTVTAVGQDRPTAVLHGTDTGVDRGDTYTSGVLPVGLYRVCVVDGGSHVAGGWNPSSWQTQCWRQQVPDTATPVQVSAGLVRSGVDFRLRPTA